MPDKSLHKKLGLKPGARLAIINPPENYDRRIGEIPNAANSGPVRFDFMHVFVKNTEDIRRFLPAVLNRLAPDGILWFSYPKKSGSIETDISRDHGWALLTKKGLRPVAQISIDENWSALRFKPADKVLRTTRASAYVDLGHRTVTLPEDFAHLLSGNRKAKSLFASLSFTHKKEYILWIESARKQETRNTRIRKAIEMLAGNIRHP